MPTAVVVTDVDGKPIGSSIGGRPKGYVQITGVTSAAAVGLGAIPEGAVSVHVMVEGGDARWRDDGTNPTSAVGMPLAEATPFIYDKTLTAIKFVAKTVNVVLNIAFY